MSRDYFELKDLIGSFDKVIVTGPHGAGNKITAYIIDADFEHLTHERWEEEVFSIEDFRNKLISKENDSYVTFCPSCSGHLHHATDLLENVLVIFTHKDINEIKSYRQRNNIMQSIDAYEVPVYENVLTYDYPELDVVMGDGLEEVTYYVWDMEQKRVVPNTIDIEHSSLSKHWKWIPKSERQGFKEWQTEIGEKP